MTRRDIARMRAATLAAVAAFFDTLEATQPANTVIRPPANDDVEVTDTDRALARRMLARDKG